MSPNSSSRTSKQMQKTQLLLVLILASFQVTKATGVFELELLQRQPDKLDKIFVCLKEAFASQLDGPCTFGNASILVDDTETRQDQAANLVRIIFTFRWTKAFTIILTTIQADQQQISAGAKPADIGANVNGSIFGGAGNSTIIFPRKASPQSGAALQQIKADNLQYLSQLSSSAFKQQHSLIIDRHVLTENEVLPSLEPASNKLWAQRFSRGSKSSLAFRFRVYCSLNYFGDGCTTFCRPRDDQFGHYNCSSTGQKVCLDGWEGANCDRAKCRAGCNQQHGYCDKPDTCQCRPGWTGLRCDECITYPGCHNGYCLSPWQCICQRNWGGVLCDQDLNYCGTHDPCRNNGTCQNIAPGKYKCNCPPDHYGENCELSLNPGGSGNNLNYNQAADTLDDQINAGCALKPCLNGGTCFAFNTSPQSTSTSARDNSSLGVADLFSESDSFQATAQSEASRGFDKYYRCQCAHGWTGDYCQWSDSLSSIPVLNETLGEAPTNSNATNIISYSNETTSLLAEQAIDHLDLISANDNSNDISRTTTTTAHVIDLKHLISWVVVASILGVFLASLLLAWCCLMAIERNGFSFIQMNIIRNVESGESTADENNAQYFSTTFRRMQEKLRDSIRLRKSDRIKPETKLNIENVLRPPPSYEESNVYASRQIIVSGKVEPTSSVVNQRTEKLNKQQMFEKITSDTKINDLEKPLGVANSSSLAASTSNLVKRGALETKIALTNPSGSRPPNGLDLNIGSNNKSVNLTCPRHGHLYRQRQQASQLNLNQQNCIHPHAHDEHIRLAPDSTYVRICSKNLNNYYAER